MNFFTDNSTTRKKLENYSYQLNSHIGKGYSSQVFKGRNDLTSIIFFLFRLIGSDKGDRHENDKRLSA